MILPVTDPLDLLSDDSRWPLLVPWGQPLTVLTSSACGQRLTGTFSLTPDKSLPF